MCTLKQEFYFATSSARVSSPKRPPLVRHPYVALNQRISQPQNVHFPLVTSETQSSLFFTDHISAWFFPNNGVLFPESFPLAVFVLGRLSSV